MKKHLTVTLLFVFTLTCYNLHSQALNIGLKGGLNFSTMLEESDYTTFSDVYNYSSGYNIGIMLSTPPVGGVGGESGLYLNTRGYRIDEGDDQNGVVGTYKTLWLEVPFKATTEAEVGPVTFFAAGGVSGSLGLSGSMDMDITVLGNTTNNTEDIVWGSDPEESDLIRIDYGAVASAGVEFMSFMLELGYYYGLANLSPYTDDNYVISSRYFTVLLGYKF